MSVHLPTSLSQLWPLLAEPEAKAMAGGTDLLVRRRARSESGPICCLERIPELRGVEIVADAQGEALRIGAATPLTALLDEEAVSARLPLLHQALRQLGSPLIRNQASLGGNLCTASPAGDGLPPLLALDAVLELASERETRTLATEEFLLGPGRTALKQGEIVLAVRIPLPPEGTLQRFEKVGKRRSLAIAVASLAACLRLENGLVAEARLAFGSVAPTAMRCRAAEAELAGRPLGRETLAAAARRVREAVRPISDVRASAEYRREVAGNLVLRLEAAQKS
ncbi:FAD binding domain-containing protein [Paucidesulfovibrio longus]|uniref:FAD binding domain-containing protein n=1 Tax=Paucidesulfovibrio longus TaxID=889 RepID=UPI0003B3886E|nr:xanthine dehydrogenase family protein subunit M [Paucidesulfovibrio longus]